MVGADAFTGLKELRKLWLDSNHITELQQGALAFSKVPTTFKRNVFTPPPGGSTEHQDSVWLFLNDNPMRCDTDLCWLLLNTNLRKRTYMPLARTFPWEC